VVFRVQLGCMNRPWTAFPFESAVEGIRAAGFEHFALLRHGGKQLISPDSTPEEAGAIASTVKQAGLTFTMLPNFIRLDGSDDDALAATNRQIDHCKRIGATILLEMGINKPPLYERYYGVMRQAAEHAAQQGVMIAIKPHGGFSRTADGTLEAVRKVDHPHYRIAYDPGNLLVDSSGTPEQLAQRMAALTVAMCIKDARVEGEQRTMVTPGEGQIDFRSIFRTLRDAGFDGPAAVETMTERDTPEAVNAEAKTAYRYLTEVLASL
jgi:sugar phosphate isomerase/epimerase